MSHLKKEETKVIWGHSGHPRRYRVLHITRGGIDIYLYCLRRQLQAAQLGEIDKRDQLHNWSVTGSCRAVSLSWWCRGSERWWSVNPTVSMVLRPQKPWGFLGTGRRGGGGEGVWRLWKREIIYLGATLSPPEWLWHHDWCGQRREPF